LISLLVFLSTSNIAQTSPEVAAIVGDRAISQDEQMIRRTYKKLSVYEIVERFVRAGDIDEKAEQDLAREEKRS
jgi:hypothetical protein